MQPLGLQLYSVREALAKDFEGVVRAVAALGYAGVEPAGFPGTTPQAAARLFRSLGLATPSAHVKLPRGDQKQETLDTVAALGCTYLVCPHVPREEFTTLDSVRRVCDRLNEANAVARAAGYTFVYHNHWWEYQPVEGRLPYQVMLEQLDPSVKYELDLYWAQTAGHDPVALLGELGAAAPLIHVKDGPLTIEAPMAAVGAGRVDVPAAVAAAGAAEWLIVEIDRCDCVMMDAVAQSFTYMISKGLARGKAG